MHGYEHCRGIGVRRALESGGTWRHRRRGGFQGACDAPWIAGM